MELKEIRYEEPKMEVAHLAQEDIATISNGSLEMEEMPEK